MQLPKNGVAKELRSYIGSLFIFLFVIGIIITLLQFPVLESNKEVVMVLIGTVAASIPTVISSITGTKPDDVNALKGDVAKRDQQIELLIKSKDDLEKMVIDLQREILKNQDDIMDKIVLKAALDFDDRVKAKSILNNKNG
jgi:low affinity Fe/Cu permease